MESPQPSFASSLSREPDTGRAAAAVAEEIRRQLGDRRADLLVAFVSHHHGEGIEALGPRLARELDARTLIGCTGESIVGRTQEIENGPALSVFAAVLPWTDLQGFDVSAAQESDGSFAFTRLPPTGQREQASVLLLADPYTFPAADYLSILNEQVPGLPVTGGMASGGMGPGQNLLFTERGLSDAGAIGVVLEGAVELRSVVSQGCRPIGKPLVITACKDNMLLKLGGRKALEVLMEMLQGIEDGERELFTRAPFLGLAIDARKSSFQRGDFLVRGLMGIDPQAGAIAVADDSLRMGMSVQFLARDAASAGEDLVQLMRAAAPLESPSARGALLFSCNGRGSRMFDEPHHDITRLQSAFHAPIPAAGFFAAGEIGPVGGRNFLHGFTASVALFQTRTQ